MREVVPAPADAKPGVTYDGSVHTLEITVGMSDDADKHLTLTTKLVTTKPDGTVFVSTSASFENTYKADLTSYDTTTAGLNKVLEWDGENMRFTNIGENETIKTCIKDGFTIHNGHPSFNKTWTEPQNAIKLSQELIKHTYRDGWKLPDMPK